ncbi:unnamed protein product, partial [Laminaria digitata]
TGSRRSWDGNARNTKLEFVFVSCVHRFFIAVRSSIGLLVLAYIYTYCNLLTIDSTFCCFDISFFFNIAIVQTLSPKSATSIVARVDGSKALAPRSQAAIDTF